MIHASSRIKRRRDRTRTTSGAALIATLLILLIGGREEQVLVREAGPFPSVGEGRIPLGAPIHLSPGRYRARAVVVRRGQLSEANSPTSEIARLAFAAPDVAEPRDVVSFRPFDFAREATRVVHFTFRVRSESERQWTWEAMPASSELNIVETRLAREMPFGVSTLRRALEGNALQRLLPAIVLLAALLCVTVLPARRNGVPRPGAGGASITLLGILAYTGAGGALYGLLILGNRAAGNDDGGAWQWLPALEPLVAPQAGLLVVAIVAAAIAFLFSIRRHPTLVWALPIAAVGLHYAGTLVGPKSDFLVYYHAGLALWAGGDPYAIHPERVLNPPPFVLACGLLPVLSAPAAGFVWFGLKFAAAAWCVPLARIGLTTFAGAGGRSGWRRPEIIALVAGARLIGMDLQFGNSNVLVLFALLAAAAAWAQGRTGGAAAALAGGVALKATPAVAIIGAGLSGRWRWAASTLLVSLVVVAVSAVALEWRAPGAGWGFLREAPPRPGDLSMGRVDNQSLRGMTDRWIGGAEISTKTVHAVPSLRWGARAARGIEALLAVAVLSLLSLLARRAGRTDTATAEGMRAWASLWAGATLAMLLLSPGSWTVHFALLYLPLVVLAERAFRGDRVAGAAFAVVALVVILPATARSLSDLCTAWSSLTLASLVALVALARPGDDSVIRAT